VARGYYEAAYVLLTKALMVNPRSYSSSMGLGLSLFRLAQTDLAIKTFRSAFELEPTSPQASLWLGIALHSGKKYSEALKSLLKANDLTKGEAAEVHWQLARVYKDMDQFARSADELELLKFQPRGQERVGGQESNSYSKGKKIAVVTTTRYSLQLGSSNVENMRR
jgi:tetratricopeptide (TPR) repeat protein